MQKLRKFPVVHLKIAVYSMEWWSIRILPTQRCAVSSRTLESYFLIQPSSIRKVNLKPIWKCPKNLIWLMHSNKKWMKLHWCATKSSSGSLMLSSQRRSIIIIIQIGSVRSRLTLPTERRCGCDPPCTQNRQQSYCKSYWCYNRQPHWRNLGIRCWHKMRTIRGSQDWWWLLRLLRRVQGTKCMHYSPSWSFQRRSQWNGTQSSWLSCSGQKYLSRFQTSPRRRCSRNGS